MENVIVVWVGSIILENLENVNVGAVVAMYYMRIVDVENKIKNKK
jgi:hypothetical protein